MSGKKVYSCDDRYFDRMHIERCYWAGFIAADGYINPQSDSLEITLATYDAHHLATFLAATKSNSIIETLCRRPNECRVRLHGVSRWIKRLEDRFNITTAKSATLKPPALKGKYLWAFIVGLLDGDGCITRNRGLLSVKFTGNIYMLSWLKSIFDDCFQSYGRCHAKVVDINHSKVAKRYEISGRRAYDILSFLKQIDVPKLERKWSRV